MPDIKTEMSKVLNAWEQDAQETQTKPMAVLPNGKKLWSVTNNVTRATFDYVQNNSGHTGEQVRTALVAKGFKMNSITSLLAQFTKQGLLVKDVEGRYYAKVAEYTTLKASRRFKAEGKRKSKIVTAPRTTRTPHTAGIAALKVAPKLEEKATTINTSSVTTAWDAETVINNIGLKQAHALYKELSTYFNG